MIDQAEWGSSLIYNDYMLHGAWNPQLIVVHWGGLTRERATRELAESTLRGWQAYHLRKGWQDIAYNYAIDELGNMYRCRGENPSGATSGRDTDGVRWNEKAVNIVWIGGKADEDGPTGAAKATLARYAQERKMSILGHVETGKATSCPGPHWLDFVAEYNDGKYDITEDDMPREQWEQMIDALFTGSEQFQGDPNYWKQMDPASDEWVYFWAAFVRAIS